MNPFDQFHSNFDQNRLEQFMAAQNMPKVTAQVQTQPQKNSHHNFFTDSLPTVIGTVGSIGGGLLGGFFGGGVGAVPGAAAGGAAGGALGQTLENMLTGDSAGKDVGKEALLGGVFGAGPMKLGKLALGIPGLLAGHAAESAAGGVAKGLVEGGAKTAAENAAGDVTQQALKTSLTGRMTSTGNKLLSSQYGTISKPIARATNPLDTIGKLADVGILKPVDAERISQAITGSDGLLTQAVTKAIGGAGKVSVDELPAVLQKSITENSLSGLPRGNALKDMVQAHLNAIQEAGGSPDAVIKAVRSLEGHAAELMGKGGTSHLATSTDKNVARALGDVTATLKDQLYNAAGANKNIANVLTPDLKKQLLNLHPNNPKWDSFVNHNIMSSKTVGDLRSAQSPFVNIQKIIDEGDINGMTYGGRLGNAFGGPGGITEKAANVVAGLVKDPASRVAGNALRDVGSGQIANQSRKGILGTAMNLGTVAALSHQASPTSTLEGALTGDTANPQDQSGQATGLQGGDATAGDSMNSGVVPSGQSADPTNPFAALTGASSQSTPTGSPYSQEALLADIQRDPTNTSKYIDTYNNLDQIFNAAGAGNFNSTTAQSLAMSDNGLSTLQQLQGLYENAGGGAGKLGGAISNLAAGAGFNNNTQAYNDLAQSSVSQLAKAINGGGTVSDSDAAVIIQALPKITDTPEVARIKFAALAQRLANARNNTLTYNGASQQPSTLEQALAQQGGF